MKKSYLVKAFIVLMVLILGVVAYKFINNKAIGEGTTGDKTITITIVDKSNDKVLVENEKFKTNAATLGEFLKENSDRLNAKLDNSQFGTFIVGLSGLETKDMKQGPWWMYSYKSPKGNVDYKVGEAPGVDSINIQDGDSANFEFTKSM